MRDLGQCLKISAALLMLAAASAAHAERNVDRDLRNASRAGNVSEMERQLQLGADPNVAYALYAAADGGQLASVQYLLAHGADPNAWTTLAIRLPLGPAASPLYVAAQHGNREILAYLKAHGADVDAESTDRSLVTCSTVLIEALCQGDLAAAQSLIEIGANVNHRSKAGDPPLLLAMTARANNSALAQLLLRHGADPDARNSRNESPRDSAAAVPGLSAMIEQLQPRPPGEMRQEEPLEVAAALHYKMLCDIGEPGYAGKVATDYAHWRGAHAPVIAQIESSPDYLQQQASAKSEFEESRAQASDGDAQQLVESLHQLCDVHLAEHFHSGAPLFEQSPSQQAQQAAQAIRQSSTPTVTVVTKVRKSPAPVAAGAPAAASAQATP
jgi:ankyrin repeat protein